MNVDVRKKIFALLPFFIIGYLGDKLSWLYRHCADAEVLYKLMATINNWALAFRNPLPSINPIDIAIGFAGAFLFWAYLRYRKNHAKKYREGREYGSARWGTPEDIRPFIDKEPDQNIILTRTESFTMNSRPKNPAYARNKNVLVIGGSGSGKTRFYVLAQLLQLHSSYCVTDPKGQVLVQCGHLLEKAGYKIKVINTINFKKSMHYNPFMYIRSEKDILKLVNTIIANTKGEGEKSTEDFWVKSEKLLYAAYIGYLWYEAPDEEKNFNSLLEFINASEIREDDETYKNGVDLVFDELEAKEPDHFAVRQYRKFKLSAGVATSI